MFHLSNAKALFSSKLYLTRQGEQPTWGQIIDLITIRGNRQHNCPFQKISQRCLSFDFKPFMEQQIMQDDLFITVWASSDNISFTFWNMVKFYAPENTHALWAQSHLQSRNFHLHFWNHVLKRSTSDLLRKRTLSGQRKKKLKASLWVFKWRNREELMCFSCPPACRDDPLGHSVPSGQPFLHVHRLCAQQYRPHPASSHHPGLCLWNLLYPVR